MKKLSEHQTAIWFKFAQATMGMTIFENGEKRYKFEIFYRYLADPKIYDILKKISDNEHKDYFLVKTKDKTMQRVRM